jgi:glycosyltransferase involved in cell wall biosynthesis
MLRYRPDVVYTNLAQNLGGFLRYASFILIVALFRTPVVVRVMGDGFNYFYERSNPALRWLIDLTLRRIDRFILRAEVLKRQFDGLVPAHKLRVVYSGIDALEFDRPRDGTPDGLVRVLFVGYLTQAKGALDLLQAVPIVAERFPNVRFQLMGERLDVERNITYIRNPQNNRVVLEELLGRKEVAEYVELLGVRSGQEKIAAFTNADLFVLPSYSEAFPTVVLEAMAAGLPVVATPVGALPEVFDERNILFVEPGNIPELAEAISRLLESKDRRATMGAYNRRMVREHFDLQSHATGMARIFQELIDKPSS